METNSSFLKNFSKSLDYLQQNDDFIKNQTDKIQELLILNEDGDKIIFNREKFKNEEDLVKFEILRKFDFDEPKEIEKIFKAETGKSFYSKKYQLLINRNELILRENKNSIHDFREILLLPDLHSIKNKTVDLRKILLEKTKFLIPESKFGKTEIWEFDAEKLIFPIKIRNKKPGDIFHPAKMTGKKKVSKFFKDEKISLLDKCEIWILVNGNDEILGIIPLRQDKRFAADEKSLQTIKFVF